MGYRMVAYEGLLARDFIVLLENDDQIISYREEPPSFTFFDGIDYHSYTPDFDVSSLDGRRLCVEVKPLHVLTELRLYDVYAHIKVAALESGYDAFELWTDREMGAIRVANASLLASERSFITDEDALHSMRVTIDRLGGRARIQDLRLSSNLGAYAFRAIVALIARRELSPLCPNRLLDDNAIVVIPGLEADDHL
jgi:hypothetical protein